jgi:hypothetical protein
MAKVKKMNVVTHGLSGKVGDILIFSQRNGRTVVSQVAHRTAKPTDKQKKRQNLFRKAAEFAKRIIRSEKGQVYRDAAKEAKAKKKGLTAYNIAFADFMHIPNIEKVDLSTYEGKTGDEIRIEATDDFAVESVHVQITDADGSVIEEGNAVMDDESGIWIYTATTDNTSSEGNKVVIVASDLPGNLTTEEVSL